MSQRRRFTALISGRVQGVGFRYYAERQAKRLAIAGCISNLADGTVEIVAEGNEEALERLLDWCHQGPPSAAVDAVQVTWAEPTGEFTEFRTRR